MFKISAFTLFAINGLICLISWRFSLIPQGDEYLFLFLIALVFMFAPVAMSGIQGTALIFLNAAFLLFYRHQRVLNWIDVVVFMALFLSAGGMGFIAQYLVKSFSGHQDIEIQSLRKKYNTFVSELEEIDRRGRTVETELSRISRLYEITKKLAPALEFDHLLDSLMDFLEENFRFSTAHLLISSGGTFIKGISKASDGSDPQKSDPGKDMDRQKVARYCEEHGLISCFLTVEDYSEVLREMGVRTESLMIFPIFTGKEMCAVLAIEGAHRSMYGRLKILVSQIGLEFRKVQLYEKVQELSIIDGLTGVYLRRHLMERLEEEVDRAERLGLTFSIAMIDVDNFKKCNDKHGHLVGDAVLKKVAERLALSVREVDMLARYGGEEFCAVFPETNKELALEVAQRVRRAVGSENIKVFDEELRVTVSVGIATYPEDGAGIGKLVEKADMALYKAKRKGRNMVCAS